MIACPALGVVAGALLVLATLPATAATGDCALGADIAGVDWLQPEWMKPARPSKITVLSRIGATTLVGTESGLYRLDGDGLSKLGPDTERAKITLVERIGDVTYVGTAKGLYRLDDVRLTRLDPTETRAINLIEKVGDELLVGTESGLVHLDGELGTPLPPLPPLPSPPPRTKTERVTSDDTNLFRLHGDRLIPLAPETKAGSVTQITQVGDATVVVADSGLFRLDDDRLIPLRPLVPETEIGRVKKITQVGAGHLVTAERGLFRLDGGRLTPVDPDTDTGWVGPVAQIGNATYVGTAKGLFRLDGNRLTLQDPGIETGGVLSVGSAGDVVVVGAEHGLYRLERGRLVEMDDHAVFNPGGAATVGQVGAAIVVGTEHGLYRLEGGELREVPSLPNLIDVNTSIPIDDRGWIAAVPGLFRYIAESYHAETRDAVLAFGTGTTVALRFAISPCLGLEPPKMLGVVAEASTASPVTAASSLLPAEVALAGPPYRRVATASVGPLLAGTYRARLAVRTEHGWDAVSAPVELRVAWTPGDYATHHLRQAVPWLAGAHTALFALLLAGARRSPWCWRVVSDPLWGRAGLWWHAALRLVPALQRWVLARWYATARRRDARPYLPVPLAGPDGALLTADDLLGRLRAQPRLWVQGGAGMGKTALVDELARRFFAPASLRAAYRRYGFIPVVVRLRDVLDVKADPAQPDRWVPELARLALRASGLRVDDPALFRAILESGSFALIFDGANETANSAALEDYARTTPEVRILVTSQGDPVKPGFELLRLPGTVADLAGPLLALFLGPARGATVLAAVRTTPLWPELTSGYDLRLLADLSGRDGSVPDLPTDRVGLYRTLLARLRYAGGPYPEAELCQAAWALWRDRVRRFDGATHLTPDLIEPLRHDTARVVRTIGGTLHEFRHDQMRGYLAALWAAQYAVSPIRLFEKDQRLFSEIGRPDQEVVWTFFAALVSPEIGEAVWQWCHDDPERAVLQHALDQRGRQHGWVLVRRRAAVGDDGEGPSAARRP